MSSCSNFFVNIERNRAVFPTAKCRLRLLKLERIKDFLLLEKEYIRNQEVFKVRRGENKGKSGRNDSNFFY